MIYLYVNVLITDVEEDISRLCLELRIWIIHKAVIQTAAGARDPESHAVRSPHTGADTFQSYGGRGDHVQWIHGVWSAIRVHGKHPATLTSCDDQTQAAQDEQHCGGAHASADPPLYHA